MEAGQIAKRYWSSHDDKPTAPLDLNPSTIRLKVDAIDHSEPLAVPRPTSQPVLRSSKQKGTNC